MVTTMTNTAAHSARQTHKPYNAMAATLLWLPRLTLPALFYSGLLASGILLSGCDGSQPYAEATGQLNLGTSQLIRQAQAASNTVLTLEVNLNDEPLRVINNNGTTEPDNTTDWSMTFNAPQFSSNALSISWFITYENVKLLIASQQSVFTTTDTPLALTPIGEYRSFGPEFDYDGDGFSNLLELNAETNPLIYNANSQIAIEPVTIAVPDSCFLMGSAETEPGRVTNEYLHPVCVDAFSIGQHEVTFEEYDRYTHATGKTTADDNNWIRGRSPVINVSHADATDYARWLSIQTGKRFRLPTEAEWELAARAGTTSAYHSGDLLTVFAANFDSIMQRPTPVGSYAPNAWDLFDTHGNVAEWTCSIYSDDYSGLEQRCDAESNTNIEYAFRGGSWRSPLTVVRSAQRQQAANTYKNIDLGFRLVLEN